MKTRAAPAQDAPSGARSGDHLPSWTAAGLAAGMALSGGMLGLRLLTGVPSLQELVQDRLLALLPGPLVGLLIDRLQFWGKPLVLISWLVGQTLAGTLLAVGFGRCVRGRSAWRRRRTMVLAALLPGLSLWVLIELLALPALGLGPLGTRVPQGAASAGWTLIACAGYGLVLVGFHALLGPANRMSALRGPPAGPAISRRHSLALVTAGGIATFTGATLWRIVDRIGERATPPRGGPVAEADTGDTAAEAGVAVGLSTEPPTPAGATASAFVVPPGISTEITPTDQFYVVSKNLVDPDLSADGWSLEVTGLVDRPLRLSYAELRALPTVDQFTTLECISNPVGGNLISTARWTGVPLVLLLDRAGVREEARVAVFTSADNYKESLPLDLARRPTTLLAHAMNGAPLPDKHGFPLRLVMTGRYGMKNPKWLTKIELVAAPYRGYWERSGWNPDRGVETMARFDTRPERVGAGTAVLLGGVAFTGDRGIDRVEVSADGGASWSPATLKPPLSPFTWVLWSYRWQVGETGAYTLAVRAVDGAGTVQTDRRHRSHPTGATGYHLIDVRVG